MLEKRWLRWLLILAGWTLVGLFFASQTYLTYLYSSGKAPGRLIVELSLSEWYVWAALTPLVLWLARRFPLERRGAWRSVAVHSLASLVLAGVKFFLDVFVRHQLLGIPGMPNMMNKLHPNILTYWVLVGVSHAFDYYRKFRDRELRASQLEARLAEARLQVLRMQLQPHFLFNTLHAISTLMHKDLDAADHMIVLLSDLLRLTLESAGAQEVPLKQELEFLGRYLEIEQTRFQDRLSVGMEIDPEALDASVPNLILQPLVENAIRHGVAPRAAPGRIEIRATRRGAMLEMQVRDNGSGLPPGAESGLKAGVGLANTRARLEQLYGPAHRLEFSNDPDGGLRVTLSIPWKAVAAAPADGGRTDGRDA